MYLVNISENSASEPSTLEMTTIPAAGIRLKPLPLRKEREQDSISFLRYTEPRPCASKTRVVASPNSVSEPRKNPTQGGDFTWLRLQVTDFKIK